MLFVKYNRERKKDKDSGKKIFPGPGFAMASCVLGCAVAKATVTWWPRYFSLIQCWNYGCSTLLPGCPDNIIIANEAQEEEGDRGRGREREWQS